jgi:CubicO group peptidase (beta-lactamase class C family)
MKYFTILLILFLASPAFCQPIEELTKVRVDFNETPGIAVGVYENGKTNFYNFGFADINSKEPVTAKTLFEIGSITKTFTTEMLAYMVSQYEVSLTDNAQKYFPSNVVLPQKNGKFITLENLAMARSGLPRLPGNLSPADPTNPYVDYTEKELFQFLTNCELSREPGSQYEYSNLGMGTLGYILAKKRGVSYRQLLSEIITKPLKMNQTFISGEVKDKKKLATGYVDRNAVKAWTWTDQSSLTGAGGIISNAEDMVTYLVAQLSPETNPLINAFKETHHERADAATMQIGLGWHIRDHKIIWHNGGTGGFRSFAGFDPEKKRAIVILTNSTNGADDLGFHWLDENVPLKELKKSVVIDPAELKKYEGQFAITPLFILNISVEDGQLKLQATNQPKVTLYADSIGKFYLKVVDARVEFSRDENQQVTSLTLFQSGQQLIGKKVQN